MEQLYNEAQKRRVTEQLEEYIPVSKAIQGPFHNLLSKDGIKEDPVTSHKELITRANELPLSILIIGKPRSGKTNAGKKLSEALDLVHITVDRWIDALEKKIAAYEPPDDLSEGKDPPKWLEDFEEEIHDLIRSGKGPNDDQIVKILGDQVKSHEAQNKGYVLDFPYYKRNETWAETVRSEILGLKAEDVSYIIDLNYDDEDIYKRTEGIRQDPETGEVVSLWEREQRKIKKKKKKEGEGEDSEEDDEESEEEIGSDGEPIPKPKIFNELEIFKRLLRLQASGMSPDQICQSLVAHISNSYDPLLRPLAYPLEGGGDFKSLLTEGIEPEVWHAEQSDEENLHIIPRRWSLWQQTDPVHLKEGRVVEGTPEFAAHYHHQVFVFESEENQKKFLANPKYYLQSAPEMPKQFRLLIAGHQGSGKHTITNKLAEKYGWKVADMNKVIADRVEELKVEYAEEHIPNNPAAED